MAVGHHAGGHTHVQRQLDREPRCESFTFLFVCFSFIWELPCMTLHSRQGLRHHVRAPEVPLPAPGQLRHLQEEPAQPGAPGRRPGRRLDPLAVLQRHLQGHLPDPGLPLHHTAQGREDQGKEAKIPNMNYTYYVAVVTKGQLGSTLTWKWSKLKFENEPFSRFKFKKLRTAKYLLFKIAFLWLSLPTILSLHFTHNQQSLVQRGCGAIIKC